MNFQKIRTYGKTPPSLTAMEKIEEGRGNDRGKEKTGEGKKPERKRQKKKEIH